ncbi:fatty acid desaturase family protein [Oligoflexus tunisiensis]|uniref:fatty acid desaturase family protein n=1 Tax=Oligoflexus tunisiensis TaxID=708132 RepID=UPI00114C93D8|nr:fatty acid desaturase [Oligoflexus tunisiensis]
MHGPNLNIQPPSGGSHDVHRIKAALPRDIYQVNSLNFGIKVALACTLCAVGVLLIFQSSIILSLVGAVLTGLMMAHFVELQHQALHNHGFKQARLNRLVGIFLGMPMLISFSHYQARHLWHHRKVGTPEDSEFFDYKLENGRLTIRQLLSHMIDVTILYRFFNCLKLSFLGLPLDQDIPYRREVLKKIQFEYKLMGLTLFTAVFLASWFNAWDILLRVWFLPFILVSVPVHFLIECPEHIICDKIDDPLRNTRTIRSNRFMEWFTNGNNFHVEHHMFPSIPMNRMSEVHRLAQPFIVYLHRSYFEFFKSIATKG